MNAKCTAYFQNADLLQHINDFTTFEDLCGSSHPKKNVVSCKMHHATAYMDMEK